MNKTIIININGIIFHIEEEAYEVLQRYMIDVKKHFGYSADSQEIVSDIENRIAEMFSERIKANKEVINMQDVEEVCAQMGRVSDFVENDPDDPAGSSYDDALEDKTLFRDPDDRWLGGVCSGLGHYFGVESIWMRLALIVLILFGGSGILLYIILWIVIPQARSRAEKMRMRGEPANLQNFKRSFEEEVGNVRRNFTAAGERMGPGLKNMAQNTKDVVSTSARILVKIIGIVLIFFCGFAIVGALFTMLAMLGIIGPASWQHIMPAYFFDPQYYGPFVVCIFLLMAIPLLLLIILALRLFIRFKFSRYVGFSMLIVWLIALFSVIYFSTTIAVDMHEDATYAEKDTVIQKDLYVLQINDVRSVQKINGKEVQFFSPRINRAFNALRSSLRIVRLPPGEQPYIVKKFEASGATFDLALERAQHIAYGVKQQDSLLTFNSHGFIQDKELIRDQGVYTELYIPEGTKIRIAVQDRYFFWGVDFDACLDEYDDRSEPSTLEFVMTSTGLRCSHGKSFSVPSIPPATPAPPARPSVPVDSIP